MRFIYNGVDLLAVETHEFLGESVYDDTGVDYLYTKLSMHVTALVNTQDLSDVFRMGDTNGAMNYRFSESERAALRAVGAEFETITSRAPTPAAARRPDLSYPPRLGMDTMTPGATRGITAGDSTPPLTHEAIRHRLETPRGQLYVFSGPGMESGSPPVGSTLPPRGQLLLRSPGAGFLCDCKNGPTPKILAVTMSVGGTNTMVVDWTCETYVNESNLNNVKGATFLLSNRFYQTHSVDPHGFTSVTTNGIALFRTDRLMVPGVEINPDALRARLFIPIPQGFVRTIDHVTGRPDVTGIEYQYTDKQVPVNFVAGPYCRASDIAVVHRQSVTSDANPLSDVLSAVERGTSILLNAKYLMGEMTRPPRRATKPPPLPPRVRAPGKPTP